MSDDFRYHRIPEEALGLAMEYAQLLDEQKASYEAIVDEYNKRIDTLRAENLEKRKAIWFKMAAAAGVDADKSWNVPGWQVDVNYIRDGFAALVAFRVPEHPTVAALREQGVLEEEPSSDEGVPEGETIN